MFKGLINKINRHTDCSQGPNRIGSVTAKTEACSNAQLCTKTTANKTSHCKPHSMVTNSYHHELGSGQLEAKTTHNTKTMGKENKIKKAKRYLSRKSRAKLSSLMNKFSNSDRNTRKLSVGSNVDNCKSGEKKSTQANNTNNCKHNVFDHLADEDEEDDDEAYKSAVEDWICSRDSLVGECDHHNDETTTIKSKGDRVMSNAVKVTDLRIEPGQKQKAEAQSLSILDKKLKTQSATCDDNLMPEEDCDIPTFLHTDNCDKSLIDETRVLLRERFAKNPDSFYEDDYYRMLTDDWTVSRFLLRRRQDPKRTAKLMEECGRFRKQYKMSEVKLWEFPVEFHRAGGLFRYAPDRVGNMTMYMRVKMYRRVPEISDVFKAFILCVLEECDRANNGRGTAVIFDLSGCGLQNVDLSFLSWLLSSFRNYCPKGVSYIVVYNLPWILNATCKLAMTWLSASNRRALRFCYGNEIEKFIAKENLPDYCGGSCNINYRHVPDGAKTAIEVCDRLDMTPEQALKIRELFKQYLEEADQIDAAAALAEAKSQYDDAMSTTTHDSFDDCGPDYQQRNTNDSTFRDRSRMVNLVSKASKFIAH